MHKFVSLPFKDVAGQIQDACEWLASLGLDYPSARINKYRESFEELTEYYEAERMQELVGRKDYFEELAISSFEANELLQIYKGLYHINSFPLVERLKKYVKGKKSRIHESDGDYSRDIGFELSLAARFASAGCEIDFGDDADLKIYIHGRTVFIECKRIKSISKINRRIKQALKQLHRRYARSDNPNTCKGLIALSIEKIANPNYWLLIGNTDNDLGNKAFLKTSAFILKYNDQWRRQKDGRTIGTIIQLYTPGLIKSNNLLTTCCQITVDEKVSPTQDDHNMFIKTCSAFENPN